jgi:hypothetical protein
MHGIAPTLDHGSGPASMLPGGAGVPPASSAIDMDAAIYKKALACHEWIV